MEDYIRNTFPNNELIIPQLVDNIPINTSLVYILTYKNVPIIVGEGKKKRARVIFHNKDYYPEAHMKSITARLHIIYGNPEFLRRYIIVCNSREEAKVIQNKIHRERGGQGPCVSEEILVQLFNNIEVNSKEYLLLKLALLSQYDALADLFKWRRVNLIDDNTWGIISERLMLNEIQ